MGLYGNLARLRYHYHQCESNEMNKTNNTNNKFLMCITMSISEPLNLSIEPFITIIRNLHFKSFKPAYSIANLGGLYYLHSYLQSKK